MQQPNSQGSSKDALEDQIQHIERQASFALDITKALKDEFAPLWAMPAARAQIDGGDAFVAQVDATGALAERFIADAAKARGLPPAQGQRLVKLLDVNKLLERGRGLEATARALRGHPKLKNLRPGGVPGRPASRPGMPQPIAPPPAGPVRTPTKKLTERLQDVLDKMTVTAMAPTLEPPPPPPTPGERRLQAFEGALSLVADVLADTGPRLEALRFALLGAQPDSEADLANAARVAGVPADLRALIPAATEALKAGPMARRAATIALDQWVQAARLAEGYTRARGAARRASDEDVGGVLAPYDVTKLKGLIVPLTNLHLTFRSVPALAALFPPPIKRRLELSVPPDEQAKPTVLPSEDEAEADEKEDATPARLSAEETSARRMALIMQWMEDPEGNAALQDITVVYRLVAEEREYQQDRVMDIGMRLRFMPPITEGEPAAQAQQRQKLMQALETSRTRQAQLQELLGYVAARRAGGG
jgi:hypothetical protein